MLGNELTSTDTVPAAKALGELNHYPAKEVAHGEAIGDIDEADGLRIS